MRAARHFLVWGIITLGALLGESRAQTGEPRRLRIPEYGLSIEVPAGAPVCQGPVGEAASGLIIFLDAGVDACEGAAARPFVALFARYNAARLPTPEAELNRACALIAGRQAPPPEGLLLGLLPSASCRVNRPDGLIDILVVAQAGDRPDAGTSPAVPPVDPGAAAPFVNYSALLHTNARRLDADLAAFRRVLFDVQIFK